MSQAPRKGPGRPRNDRIRVVVKLTPEGNRLLAAAAKRAECSKGEYIERLLGLMHGRTK